MDLIFEWIRNIVIYVVLNTIIMNLLGNSSYKKYVSIVSGMILVLIVITPVIKLLQLEPNFNFFFKSNDFAIEASEFEMELRQMEEEQVSMIFKEYEQKIKNQVEEILLEKDLNLREFTIRLDKNVESDHFGEILGLEIKASVYSNDALGSGKIAMIENVEIASIEIDRSPGSFSENLPSPMEINIKNKLSDFYNIEPANINISIQGG